MEAELGALFVNCQIVAAIQMTLIEMVHTQPPIPKVTDTATKETFVNNNIRKQSSISIDIRFYWVRDRFMQLQLLVYWIAGEHNMENYFTKHHFTCHYWGNEAHMIIHIQHKADWKLIRQLK